MSKSKTGRPRINIDWNKVDSMLAIQCTGEEIASVLDVSYDTIERRCKQEHKMSFADYSAIKRQKGRASLRRRQYKAAVEEGNVPMMIWLGKQMLGQKDKQEVDNTSSDNSMSTQINISADIVKNISKKLDEEY